MYSLRACAPYHPRDKLDAITAALSKRPSTSLVFNPYYGEGGPLSNLDLYFDLLSRAMPKTLLLGEAIGWRGARSTGIPFTSGALLKKPRHRALKEIRKNIEIEGELSEVTAGAVWDFLGEESPLPILWNAFPFHPHKPGNTLSNRRPSAGEIEEGKFYVSLLCDAFLPQTLIAIGRVGEGALKALFPGRKVHYARHPGHGGKGEFLRGMRRALHAR